MSCVYKGSVCHVSTKVVCVMCTCSVSTTRTYTPRTGSLEAKIQAIEADNQRILSMSGLGMQAHTPPAFTFVSLCESSVIQRTDGG